MDFSDQTAADVYAEWRPHNLAIDSVTGLEYFGNLTGKTVVEFGCGAGAMLKTYVKLNAPFCLGIDINEPMIKSGGFKVIDEKEYSLQRQIQKNEQVCCIVKDCFGPFDRYYGQFDFASCVYCIQRCSNETELQGLLANILKMLKPNGKMYIAQPPYLANTLKDQGIIADTIGVLKPLKSEAGGQDPFYGSTIALRPAPNSVSKTGRPFTREKLFTFQDYFWSKEKVLDNLRKAGYINVKLLQPSLPEDATSLEKEQIKSLEETFVFVGAEKPSETA